ncbi:LysR substrate-binding domain-containing protein [Frankia sp. AiPs1]|uniref:LysR substrate-binding domain-containing protein n=1 Tax=Frankia sp. AiPs1 TaxID=573493 RepID=UPI0020430ECA|nr:LysR substrate-binding domain-containing protein [Frankia sp. AiPs1]MCM3922489.1 LysR substrate-binding domain-containing protein [Frankia sp. AiPs1]
MRSDRLRSADENISRAFDWKQHLVEAFADSFRRHGAEGGHVNLDVELDPTILVGSCRRYTAQDSWNGMRSESDHILQERHPDLLVQVHEMDFRSPVAEVVRGELDLGLAQDWENAPMTLPQGVRRVKLMEDIAQVALPTGHPLATPGRDSISMKDVLGERWISRTVGSTCHDRLIHTMQTHGAEARIGHIVMEYPTQLAMVAAGMGLAMVPRLGQDPVPAGVRVLALHPRLRRSIYAVWRADNDSRPAVRHAIGALSAAARAA